MLLFVNLGLLLFRELPIGSPPRIVFCPGAQSARSQLGMRLSVYKTRR